MISGTTTRDASAVLASARGARAAADAAEATLLADVVEFAHLHTVEDLDEAATWWSGSRTMGQDTGIPIAGEGCPLISEFAVAELATALHLTTESGRHLVGQALELAHRLPRLWARVQDGSLPAWRARRVAEATIDLNAEAAGFVDRMVAPFAHQTGPAQTQRLVDEAIARYMPEHAREIAERSAEQRYFTIDHQQVSFTGTTRVHGELDLPDALDLEDAVRRGAEQLKALGNTDSLDVRRAAAVGMLARGQHALEFDTIADISDHTSDDGAAGVSAGVSAGAGEAGGEAGGFEAPLALRTSTTQEGRPPKPVSGREVVLVVHLSQDAVSPGGRDLPVFVENGTGRLVTAGQVAQWCGRPETTGVTVKPVIDLGERIVSAGYQPSDRLSEQVRLRDRTCVFPYCHRPARACDLDHVIPHDQGGATASENLACLCRLHHRMKTHGGWDYAMTEPGVFLWRSPRGHTWRRGPVGTTDLTPPTVEPSPKPAGHPPDQ